MEQGSEDLDGCDDEVEQPLEAMQLPVPPMYLDVDYLQLEKLLAEKEVEVVVHFDVDDVDVEGALIQA